MEYQKIYAFLFMTEGHPCNLRNVMSLMQCPWSGSQGAVVVMIFIGTRLEHLSVTEIKIMRRIK